MSFQGGGRGPPQRLVDVLKKNRPEVLRSHAQNLAALQTALSASAVETRFRQNTVLISPKALHLLHAADNLRKYGVFAIYKPPFCPMKRQEANRNYHKVSVESFLSAALSSRDILPVIRETLRPSEMNVRVLYSLADEASGPVVASLHDKFNFSHSTNALTFHYQMLVAGHLSLSEEMQQLQSDGLHVLFPESTTEKLSSSSASCSVLSTGFYAHHAVSLVNVRVASPPSALPPALGEFTKRVLGTFIIGDPAMLSTHPPIPLPKGFSLRGDCDFPRVFVHLREVEVNTDLDGAAAKDRGSTSSSSTSEGDRGQATEKITFSCNNCLEPIVQTKQVFGLKGISMNIRDGSWTPMSELVS